MLKSGASSGVRMAFSATAWLLGNKKSLYLAIGKEAKGPFRAKKYFSGFFNDNSLHNGHAPGREARAGSRHGGRDQASPHLRAGPDGRTACGHGRDRPCGASWAPGAPPVQPPGVPDQASCLRRPNFLMREQSVVGLMPSRAAAPSPP